MTSRVDPYFNIDDVHRDVVDKVFDENGLGGSVEERRAITGSWHRLDAWPDFATALRRLRRHRICVSFTILSLSLVVDVSRRNGIHLGRRDPVRDAARVMDALLWTCFNAPRGSTSL